MFHPSIDISSVYLLHASRYATDFAKSGLTSESIPNEQIPRNNPVLVSTRVSTIVLFPAKQVKPIVTREKKKISKAEPKAEKPKNKKDEPVKKAKKAVKSALSNKKNK